MNIKLNCNFCKHPHTFSNPSGNYYYCWSLLYSAILGADSLRSCHTSFWMSGCIFFWVCVCAFFFISTKMVYWQCYLAVTWLVPHESAAISAYSVYTIQPCTNLQCNRYQTKSQHRKLTLKKKFLPLPLEWGLCICENCGTSRVKVSVLCQTMVYNTHGKVKRECFFLVQEH